MGNLNCLQGGKLCVWETEVERTVHYIVFYILKILYHVYSLFIQNYY